MVTQARPSNPCPCPDSISRQKTPGSDALPVVFHCGAITLEGELGGELQDARQGSIGDITASVNDLAEFGRGDVGDGIGKLGMVEDVEGVHTDFQVEAFREGGTLHERNIEIGTSRSAQDTARRAPIGSESRIVNDFAGRREEDRRRNARVYLTGRSRRIDWALCRGEGRRVEKEVAGLWYSRDISWEGLDPTRVKHLLWLAR